MIARLMRAAAGEFNPLATIRAPCSVIPLLLAHFALLNRFLTAA